MFRRASGWWILERWSSLENDDVEPCREVGSCASGILTLASLECKPRKNNGSGGVSVPRGFYGDLNCPEPTAPGHDGRLAVGPTP
jgi:hypothetical protein